MLYSLTINNQIINYKIVRKKKLKNSYISVCPNEGVLIKTNPYVLDVAIKDFIIRKADWIFKKQKELLLQNKYMPLKEGSKIYILGKPYILKIIKMEGKEKKSILKIKDHNILIFIAGNKITYDYEKAIDDYYTTNAKMLIPEIVNKWEKITQLYPTKIGFRKAKTRWGSCSSENHLSFNTQLMKLPGELIEYIVVHEIVHIKHKNHSKDYWDCVAGFMPNHKAIRKKLRQYEKII